MCKNKIKYSNKVFHNDLYWSSDFDKYLYCIIDGQAHALLLCRIKTIDDVNNIILLNDDIENKNILRSINFDRRDETIYTRQQLADITEIMQTIINRWSQ
jgi:hypothetical protein